MMYVSGKRCSDEWILSDYDEIDMQIKGQFPLSYDLHVVTAGSFRM